MPESVDGRFSYPGVDEILVGMRGFYIHEDPWDGAPILREALNVRSSVLWSLRRQEVRSGYGDETSEHWFVPLYGSPEEARREYLAKQQWEAKHRFPDLNRPGDKICRDAMERNVNILLRMNWANAKEEARSTLETWLKQAGLNQAPVQQHRIGDRVRAADGSDVVIAEARLQRRFVSPDDIHPGPFKIYYKDENGYEIDISDAL